MISSTSILIAALCVVGLCALFAIALCRAASRGDIELDPRRTIEARDIRELSAPSRASYAGLARARSPIAYERSTTAPSPSIPGGRARASSLTTRPARARLNTPGGGARP